ncbi:MAG: ABC transporter permease subunit [Lachnospiraceae bacterium]|nr:ABC transporter permease subunit [Lachnospiraceae bacterium]
MRQVTALIGKEFLALKRTGKLWIFIILFFLFGIMNPAVAKLTPWMMEMMAESFSETGLVVESVEVSALTSWMQFYKNIPIALIVFLLLFSSILTEEYQKGTLIQMVTKGAKRWKMIGAKYMTMAVFWTFGYLVMFAVTYGYNEYFWDNSTVSHVVLSAMGCYITGMWLISLIIFWSAVFSTSSFVLLAAGGVFFLCYLAGMIPELHSYLPLYLMETSDLLIKGGKFSEYVPSLLLTAGWSVVNLAGSVFCFNRKRL